MKFYRNQDFISIIKYISIKISAKKFAKNCKAFVRHYNLLPNQGHAVQISMKLYKKFTEPESV